MSTALSSAVSAERCDDMLCVCVCERVFSSLTCSVAVINVQWLNGAIRHANEAPLEGWLWGRGGSKATASQASGASNEG